MKPRRLKSVLIESVGVAGRGLTCSAMALALGLYLNYLDHSQLFHIKFRFFIPLSRNQTENIHSVQEYSIWYIWKNVWITFSFYVFQIPLDFPVRMELPFFSFSFMQTCHKHGLLVSHPVSIGTWDVLVQSAFEMPL